MADPVIDITALITDSNNESSEVKKAVSEISKACQETGFFYIKDSHFSNEIYDQVLEEAKLFFNQPKEEKEKFSQKKDKLHNRGYVDVFDETLYTDHNKGTTKASDYKESLDMYFPWEGQTGSDFLGGQPLKPYFAWPQVHHFQDTFTAYFKNALILGYAIFRAFEIDLHLPSNYFKNGNPSNMLRISDYPPQTKNGKIVSEYIACDEHIDWGWLTTVKQDSCGGLQARRRNDNVKWFDVPPIPNTHVVNLGEMTSRLTNGHYFAAPHRVVSYKNTERRYSVPCFFEPNYNGVVDTIPIFVNEKNPAKYKSQSIRYGDFLKDKMDESFKIKNL